MPTQTHPSPTNHTSSIAHRVSNLKRKRVKSSADIVQTMLKATSSLVALQNVSDLFTRTIAEICSTFLVSHAVLLIIDPDNKDELVVAAEHYTIPNPGSNRELALSRTVLRAVLETGEAFYSYDALQDPRLMEQASIVALDLRAAAAVPLVGRRGTMGVLYTAVLGDQESFLTENYFLPLLQTIANQAALLLEMAGQQEGSKAEVVLSETDLVTHGLSSFLKRMRRRLNLSPIDIQIQSRDQIVDPEWVVRVERGEPLDFQGDNSYRNSAKLIELANVLKVSPDILFAIAERPIVLENLVPETERWLPEMLQDQAVQALLQRLYLLHDEKKRAQVITQALDLCERLESL